MTSTPCSRSGGRYLASPRRQFGWMPRSSCHVKRDCRGRAKRGDEGRAIRNVRGLVDKRECLT